MPAIILVGSYFVWSGWTRGAFAWVFTVCGVEVAILLLKLVSYRCGHMLGEEIDLRSPSGHTAAAAAIYGGTLALAFAPFRSLGRAALIGLAIALLIGTTRVLLHMHTVADVIVGGVIGTAAPPLIVFLAGPVPSGWPHRGSATRLAVTVIPLLLLLHGRDVNFEDVIRRAAWHLLPPGTCSRIHTDLG